MSPVDGSASLSARRSYLRRRRGGRLGPRGSYVAWIGVGATAVWVTLAAIFGFLH
jgi:hypothetical protein